MKTQITEAKCASLIYQHLRTGRSYTVQDLNEQTGLSDHHIRKGLNQLRVKRVSVRRLGKHRIAYELITGAELIELFNRSDSEGT